MLLTLNAARSLLVCLVFLNSAIASGQDFPNKPIRIVTANAGGGDDYTSRTIAQALAVSLGQPVIVDNRSAAFIAADVVAKSPPDGYSLTVQGAGFWINALLRKVPYDVVSDFVPISLISRDVFVIAVHPALPVNSVKELIALAKAKPGEINHGTGVSGTSSHLAVELLKSMAAINMVRVSYKGAAAVISAALANEVQVVLTDVGLLMPHVKSGKLKALAVTGAQPTALAPGLPTVAASGLPGFEAVGMTGIFAPAKTPSAVITRLNQDIVRVVNLADVKERFINTQSEVVGSSPEQYAATIRSEIAKMSKLIKDANIRVD